MTTDYVPHYYDAAQRHEVSDLREFVAAVVTAAGFVLLLPGAAFLMSFLDGVA